jgi:hypothetical protein
MCTRATNSCSDASTSIHVFPVDFCSEYARMSERKKERKEESRTRNPSEFGDNMIDLRYWERRTHRMMFFEVGIKTMHIVVSFEVSRSRRNPDPHLHTLHLRGSNWNFTTKLTLLIKSPLAFCDERRFESSERNSSLDSPVGGSWVRSHLRCDGI